MEEAAFPALVVYESFFGNTRSIAEAVAEGLRLEGCRATVQAVSGAVPPTDVARYELLVVGGPTHAFGLSRESTRADAERRGGSVHQPGPGLRDWLDRLPRSDSCVAAAFDTRVEKVRRLPMSASRAAARILRRRGYTLVSKPAGFVVGDVEGPLGTGETQRAIAWGRSIGRATRLQRVPTAPDRRHGAR